MKHLIVTETNGQMTIFRNQNDDSCGVALMAVFKGEGVMLQDADMTVAYAPGLISKIMQTKVEK